MVELIDIIFITELKVELTKDIKKIVAFANTNDGTIYVGINDDGNIIGLKNSKKDLEALSGMIREGIKSDLILYTKIYIEKIEGKDIIVIKVNEALNTSEEIIKKMLIESNSDSFENNISSKQDLHFEYMKNVFEHHNIDINNSKLKTLNIIETDNKYTNLGLLLSDECPYSIKCAIFNGKNKLEFKDRCEFT